MCFRIINSDKKRKIATKDIPVWKVVMKKKGEYVGPYYQDFIYRRDMYFLSRLGKPSIFGDIYRGLHCHTTFENAKQWKQWDSHNEVVVRMTIPKGASYYVNHSQYVANCLYFGIKPPKSYTEIKEKIKKKRKIRNIRKNSSKFANNKKTNKNVKSKS